jgi:hypothetical protein
MFIFAVWLANWSQIDENEITPEINNLNAGVYGALGVIQGLKELTMIFRFYIY